VSIDAIYSNHATNPEEIAKKERGGKNAYLERGDLLKQILLAFLERSNAFDLKMQVSQADSERNAFDST
jgi:hypothetical protein